jgi:hypothetical protein
MERTRSSETSEQTLSDTVQNPENNHIKLPFASFAERRDEAATTPTFQCDVQSETATAGVKLEMPDMSFHSGFCAQAYFYSSL